MTVIARPRPLTARELEILAAITRREFVIGGTALAGLLVAGCGGDTGDDAIGEICTIESNNRSMEVPEVPQRVVAASGSSDTDIVAVGVVPVSTTSFAGPLESFPDSTVITENIPRDPEELFEVRPDVMLGGFLFAQALLDDLERLFVEAGV
jgi:ABC-type Fe3+-hydroxamate transport system substrate-binding protein